MKKKLTILIPFFNEGEEVIHTIESIYATTSPKLFNIIAIDDGSNIPTLGLEKYKEVTVFRNPERLGVGASRTKAAKLANSPYIFIIDAHMRFRDDKWCEKIIDALKKEPKTIFCTCSIALDYSRPDVTVNNARLGRYYGANLLLYNHGGIEKDKPSNYRDIIVPKCATKLRYNENEIYEIPCILGATYGVNLEWFNKLKGFEGLKMWGSSEPFLSLKSWLAGGKCKIIPQIEIGHYYKTKAVYSTPSYYLLYNKMFIAKTIFPMQLSLDMIGFLGNNSEVRTSKILIDANKDIINDYKEYYNSILIKSIFEICNKFSINYNWPDNIPHY
ncbi:MAG: glycosyltransferase [Promethearchaeota archaeon]